MGSVGRESEGVQHILTQPSYKIPKTNTTAILKSVKRTFLETLQKQLRCQNAEVNFSQLNEFEEMLS